MDPLLASILMFAGNFAPKGWAFCNGQLIPISQNTALFSLLGTTYGGDGRSTFALPDFRGRVPIHWGQGPGLSTYQVGDRGGTESTTLSVVNMPAHNHLVNVDNTAGGQHVPANHLPGVTPPNALAKPYSLGAANATMNPQMIAMAGASQPFSNLQPYLAVSFIIALIGIFPARS